ncbi:MAG: hypothetical protein KatS3mg105_1369 [Gemmatales bacterium]|nr:MAG: hypothetical protein KatS3mg105_1369 [Gemmatales bacterium]
MRILEGIVTTRSPSGDANIAPMGPFVDNAFRRLVLRPFRTSTTYRNLKTHGEGVFHVTDDVLLLAQSAVGLPSPMPRLAKASKIDGFVLCDACRAYEFRVLSIDDRDDRTRIEAEVVQQTRFRDFFGFNRAMHAVLEAAILATRLHLLPTDQVAADMTKLQVIVDKTGGATEHEAFDFLRAYIQQHVPDRC